jgi:hypothetical protein
LPEKEELKKKEIKEVVELQIIQDKNIKI